MLLKFLKSNRPVNLLIFPAIATVFWLKYLFDPELFEITDGHNCLLLGAANHLTGGFVYIQILISLILVIVAGVVIQLLNDRFSVVAVRTKLPATFFVLLISGFTQLHTLHPVFPATIFLALAVYRMFIIYDEVKPWSGIFNTGFLLGLGALFYFNIVFLLPAFLAGIVILGRETGWRSFVILLTGFAVPLYLAFGYAFLNGKTEEFMAVISSGVLKPAKSLETTIPFYIYISYLGLLTLAGSIKIMQQYDSQKISTRKYFLFFFLLSFFSVLSYVFVPGVSFEIIMIIALPVTYLVSNLFVFTRSNLFGELLFSVFVVIVIFMQFSKLFF